MSDAILETSDGLYLPVHGTQYVEDGPDADLLALVDVHAVRVDLHIKF